MEENQVSTFVMSIIGIAMVLFIGLTILSNFSSNLADTIVCNSADATDFNGTVNCQYFTCANNSQTLATPYTVNSTRVNCYNASAYGTVTNTQATANIPAAYNVTNSIESNLSGIPSWIGILITIALAFIVLGYFYNR